jgi:prephenate dehydrogenase
MNIAIIGLGLMGGSLALSLQKLDFVKKIVGYDHNTVHEQTALKLGLVDEICTNRKHSVVKERLKFDSSSKVLICSTEGDTDPALYKEIVERKQG